MNSLFQPSPAERRLLQDGRLAGPMTWVIAIMMFLTILVAAGGLAVAESARALRDDLAGRITIQIVEANPLQRESQVRAMLREIGSLSAVERVEAVPQERLVEMLQPWLGERGFEAELPIPALIDVELRQPGPRGVREVRQAAKALLPSVSVTEQQEWLAPLTDLLGSLKWLSAILILLVAAATAAAVVLAVRAALNTHRSTIDVLHLLGATDRQVATLFQRRIALDSIVGGLAGLAAALLVIALLGRRVAALGSGIANSALLGWSDWAILLSVPAIGAALATFCARLTVLAALRRTL